jgi:hypothetical protein
MPSRLTLAAGVLGVASLAFVGVGGYAAFTSNVSLDSTATSGTFILNATGQSASGRGGVTVANRSHVITTPGASNATVTWSTPQMDPGDPYSVQFNVGDVGTIKGEVSNVTYTPPATPGTRQNALLSSMSVTVQEYTNGGWQTLGGGGTANVPHTFATYGSGSSDLTPGGASIPFRVIYTISNATSTNLAENVTVAPTLSFVGTSIP